MKRKILILSLFLSSLMIIGCKNQINFENKTINKDETIIAFGDSLTFGMGAKPIESYPERLAEITGYHVVNAGLNGDTAKGALKRLHKEVEENNPALVILGLGGNDMLKKNDDELEENLILLVNYLKEKNIQVVLLATPKPDYLGGMVGYLTDAPVYKDVAIKTQTFLIQDVYSQYLSKNEYKSDLIHLNSKGYNLVAEKIAKELKDKQFIK